MKKLARTASLAVLPLGALVLAVLAARLLPETTRPRPVRSTPAAPASPERECVAETAPTVSSLEARRDAEGLLACFEHDATLLRFEALRAYLRLDEPGTAARLVDLLAREEDPDALALLGEALGAGGEGPDAQALARFLDDASAPRRLAAASATLEIGERAPLPPGLAAAAVATLATLAQDEATAFDATRALGDGGPLALAALERLSLDIERPGPALAAAEALREKGDARADAALAALAASSRDEAVRRLAATYSR